MINILIEKNELNNICHKYFNDLNPKHLSEFEEVTPKGNKITGYITHKPNQFLGSILITTLNDEPVEQFIHSMPKIHYFKDEKDVSGAEGLVNFCYEKLDGTCLILYPLKNHNGEIIEIVPKTRGRAVADTHFIDLYNKVNQKPIIDYYKKYTGILLFELYGILNQHDIIYYDTGVDIRLIGIYDEDGECTNNRGFVEEFGFKLPDTVFELYLLENTWYLEFTSKKYMNYLDGSLYSYSSITDAVNGLKELLETLNKNYQDYNNRLALEGVVINTITLNGHKKFLKCKPSSIELKHKSEKGVPKSSIRKECYKYFDEYGAEAEELYKTNPSHHTRYLYRMLNEEYPIEYIHKSKNKIETVFLEILDSKIVPVSIHEICNEIYNEYGVENDIGYCMRKFAEKYPTKKKDSRLVYSVLSKFYNKKK